ncbi:hypothetical protein C6A77_06010 [Pseudomonas sp. AFG_SD02_1510_Pfu_092]|uniref:hypothetical protein n=1 Tax=Pseudomonas sp. AFG_SD02_1510_Pfu_092 TaxID=2259497 RepID=UPI000DEF6488|nr:hypothetical protein [Pseudomonas sp. AFG_SD02_1510_Pfu_092]RCL28705.1 hypothetical protein C6A77_06010 [Pseudomonas sp. AFG_SD02_1510_Pfu_092]
MTEEEAKDVLERIEYELGLHQPHSATRIVIHDLGLWARLETASGGATGLINGGTLFGWPVLLEPKCDASYTVLSI